MRVLLTALLLMLAGCGGEPDDPATQVRAWVAKAEAAIEARSVIDSSELIADAYRDDKNHEKRSIVRILLGYFHRHKQIHLLTRVLEPVISHQGDRAEVTVFVAMAGVPVESAQALFSVRADFHRFDLALVKQGDDWLLVSSRWQRATLDDLTAN